MTSAPFPALLSLKCLISVLMFGTSAALIGGSSASFGFKLNHPVLMAQNASLRESNMLAVHEEKLSQLTRDSQAGLDDRRELHAAIGTLTDRINVDEAEARTAARVFGLLFSIFTGSSTLIAIFEFFRRKIEKQ